MPTRRQMLAASLAFAAGGAAPALAQTKSLPGSLAARFAATLSAHDIDKFAALFADSYVNHQMSAAAPPPAAGMTPKQGTVGFFKARLTGISDLKVVVEALVVGRDRVAASFVYTGTHGGVYFGIAPTGKP